MIQATSYDLHSKLPVTFSSDVHGTLERACTVLLVLACLAVCTPYHKGMSMSYIQLCLESLLASLPISMMYIVMHHCSCTGLFSATQTEAVVQLARAGLRNAVRIKVAIMPSAEQKQQQSERAASGQTAGPSGAQRTPSSLDIQYLMCDHVHKVQQLVKFIQVCLGAHVCHTGIRHT